MPKSDRELIVDLHTHSHYSRATSRDCNLAGLYKWGKIKGINIIGTGDFTHPHWYAEIKNQLVRESSGLYRLKPEVAKAVESDLPPSVRDNILLFVPTVEISTIYSKNGRVRKLHSLIVMPSLEAAGELNARLSRIGNLKADGRPILGLDAKELLRHSLQVSPDSLFIPAHIWTPWFALFGSNSGFDSLQECFEELTPQVRAVETGLSSDPAMNWRLSQLDGITITSNSDAHSPSKLGREATVVRTDPSYASIIGAIRTNDQRLVGTIEFFPEEGKYHYDGHRDCGVRLSPDQTRELKGLCPTCGKTVTIGVDYRVGQLADRAAEATARHKRVEYIIPLTEVLGELMAVAASSKKVLGRYQELINRLGHEFDILRSLPLEQVQSMDPQLSQALSRLRAGEVVREPGYDGLYGTIRVFKNDQELSEAENQMALL